MSSLFILVLFIFVVYQNNRIARLEQALRQLDEHVRQGVRVHHMAEPSGEPPLPNVQAVPPALPVQPTAYAATANSSSDAPGALTRWLKDNWMMKLGAFLFLIGIGWFVSYAFAQGWIGPYGRIMLGLLTGAALMLVGQLRFRVREIQQAAIFLVVGSAVILATTWAARELYDFFTPASALLIMLASIVLLAVVSIERNVRSLAIASLILSGIAPLLTNTPDPSLLNLFTYLLLVVVGTIWVVLLTGWRVLVPAALALVAVYSPLVWEASIRIGALEQIEERLLLAMAFVLAGLFFVVSTFGLWVHRKRKDRVIEQVALEYVSTAAGVGLFLIGWILIMAEDHWQSTMLAVWALGFAAVSFAFVRYSRMLLPFLSYGMVAAVLLGVALSCELEGPTLSIALTLEVFGTLALVYWFVPRVSVAQGAATLLAVPVILSLIHLSSSVWRFSIVHGEHAFLLILIAGLVGLGLFLRVLRARFDDVRGAVSLAEGYLVGAAIYGLIWIWLVLHGLLLDDQDVATFVALMVYTVIGVGAYIHGMRAEAVGYRRAGAALLCFVVARLLLVDVWQMGLEGRVITFLGIGILLLATAFISQQRKEQKAPISHE